MPSILIAVGAAGCGGGGGSGAVPASPSVVSGTSTGGTGSSGAGAPANPSVPAVPAVPAIPAAATPAGAIATAAPTAAPPVIVQSTAFQNGVEYATTFRPYASTSVWNTPVSAYPTIALYSAAVVAHQFPNGQYDQPFRNTEAGTNDYSHPIYYSSTSDPLVNIRCNQYCDPVDNGGPPAQIRVPARAQPAGGADHHFDVIQPDGTEISMWAVNESSYPLPSWTNGSTLTAGNIANCGSFTAGTGTVAAGPGSTAGGACNDAGIVHANELIAGRINHALFFIAECAVGWQFPAFPNASTGTCTSGVGPPLGGRMWYDVPDATTNANPSLQPWEKAILNALHDYGAYLEDDVGGGAYATGIGASVDSEEPMMDFGTADPFAGLAAQGWTTISIPNADGHGNARLRWLGADPWRPSGVDLPNHIHWLAPCSAQGTC
jgi:hypothetical protein